MKKQNPRRIALAKGISSVLNVSINMAYKYISGYSSLKFKQAVELEDARVISLSELKDLDSYFAGADGIA